MLCDKLTIRHATPADRKAVRNLEKKAFGRIAEADLVDQLVPASEFTLSLVAICNGKIIGHILLTEIDAPIKALALAPLAVHPKYREMQVGTHLVQSAVKAAREKAFKAVFVLGDVLYYERFGFSGKLADPFDVAWQGKHFMAMELEEGVLIGKKGPIRYPEPFFNI